MYAYAVISSAVLTIDSLPLFVIFYGLMQVRDDPVADPSIVRVLTFHAVFRKFGSWVCPTPRRLGSGTEKLTLCGSDMLGLISSESYATAIRGTW